MLPHNVVHLLSLLGLTR